MNHIFSLARYNKVDNLMNLILEYYLSECLYHA